MAAYENSIIARSGKNILVVLAVEDLQWCSSFEVIHGNACRGPEMSERTEPSEGSKALRFTLLCGE